MIKSRSSTRSRARYDTGATEEYLMIFSSVCGQADRFIGLVVEHLLRGTGDDMPLDGFLEAGGQF